MQTTAERQALKLETLQFVLHLRDVIGTRLVMKSLLEVSKKTWDDSFDANTDIHLIQGVAVSTNKSDAIKTYIAKIVKVYLNAVGVRTNAWTNESLCADNFTNVTISNKISAQVFTRHEELFEMVSTRLLGFDLGLVTFCTANAPAKRTEALVVYMAQRYNLGDKPEKILADYPDAIHFLKEVIDEPDYLQYFNKTVGQIIEYYDVGEATPELNLMSNPFDTLAMLYVGDV
jgi:hypothetical protein